MAIVVRCWCDRSFDHERRLRRQKRLAINEIYDIRDGRDEPLPSVQRPAHPFRRGFALLLGIAACSAAGGPIAAVVTPRSLRDARDVEPDTVAP